MSAYYGSAIPPMNTPWKKMHIYNSLKICYVVCAIINNDKKSIKYTSIHLTAGLISIWNYNYTVEHYSNDNENTATIHNTLINLVTL